MFKICALLLDKHYTSNNKKEKRYRKKIGSWIVKNRKLGNISLYHLLIHLKAESLNIRKFPSISDFELPIFYITNRAFGFLSLSWSQFLSPSPCPLAMCSAGKHCLLWKKVSWAEEAEVNHEMKRGKIWLPTGISSKKREAGQPGMAEKPAAAVTPSQNLQLTDRRQAGHQLWALASAEWLMDIHHPTSAGTHLPK